MATAPALITMEQYLQTSYSPDVDFLDGVIEERSVGEYDHGVLQGLLFIWFLRHKNTLRAVPVVEQRIRVTANRIRICDVAVVHAGKPRQQVAIFPPLVCIEVLSPEDRLARAENVLADYHAMGVRNIWLIDPARRSGYIFEAGRLRLAQTGVLAVADTDATLDLRELFADLDESDL